MAKWTRCPTDQIDQSTGYDLAEIAKVCLQGPEASKDALLVCQWIEDATAKRPGWGFELGELIETLLTLHPGVALDRWLGDTQNLSQGLLWRLVPNEDRNPFG